MMRREWFDPFRSDVEVVFAAAEQLVQNYPGPISHYAGEQLQLANPLLRDSGHSYIGYIIPLWMQHSGPGRLPSETAHKLSTACLIHMLYFLIQDEIMDQRPEDITLKLALGNLYYVDALGIYRELFGNTSLFWSYYRQYVMEWSTGVTEETMSDPFGINPLRSAQKAAPLLLGAVGTLLLLEQEERIPSLCADLNIALMTLQMTDDFTDFNEDAEHGNYNSFLSHVSSAMKLDYPAYPVSEQVIRNTYNSGFMKSYADIARHHYTLTSSNDWIPQLRSFNLFLCSALDQAIEEVEAHKKSLMHGGFSYLIHASQQS